MANSTLIYERPGKNTSALQAVATPHPVSRFKALGKETALVFLGYAAAGLGSLASVRLLTYLLPPAVFGDVALSLTVVTIIQYCYAGTSAAAMRFFMPAMEKGLFPEYLGAAWRLQHLRDLLVVPFVVLGLAFLMLTTRTSLISLGLAALAVAVISSYGTFMDGMQNAARQRAIVALHQGATSWLRMGCAAILVVFVSASAACVLWGFALGAALTAGSQYIFYRRIKRNSSRAVEQTRSADHAIKWHATMTSYAWPYVIWAIPAWLQLSSDRWALDWFASAAEVGIYAALYQLAFLPINTMTQLITQLAMPILFARAGDLSDAGRVARSRSLNTKLVNISLFWTIFAVAIVAILQVPLGHLLLDVRYHGSLHLLPLLVLAAGLFATAQLAELRVVTANQTTALIRPKTIIALFASGTFFLGAYLGGITGVVWTAVVTRLALLLWVLRIDRRIALQMVGTH